MARRARLRAWFAVLTCAAALGGPAGCADEVGPRIVAVVPSSAAVGETVDIVGERLLGTQLTVAFGGRAASLLLVGETRLRVRVPDGLSGLTILVVSVDGRASKAVDFYVTSPLPDGGVDR